jgi:integrating conjugative element protein (TIGR03749 family)
MKRFTLMVLLCSVTLTFPALAVVEQQTERIVWDKTPIPLTLAVGKDRVVHFPVAVKIGVPKKLAGRLISTSVDGTVYWRAVEEFAATLVLVQEVEGDLRTYSFYLEAVEQGASTAAVEILRPHEPEVVGGSLHAQHGASEASTYHGYVALTRFAAQQLYAPTRLLRELPDVHRIPVPDQAPVALMTGIGVDPGTMRPVGADVEALPLMAWAGEAGLYVTAVRLRNRSPRALILDPRTAFHGRWLAATFQHAQLRPAGHVADTSVVYLISARRFEDTLQPYGEMP